MSQPGELPLPIQKRIFSFALSRRSRLNPSSLRALRFCQNNEKLKKHCLGRPWLTALSWRCVAATLSRGPKDHGEKSMTGDRRLAIPTETAAVPAIERYFEDYVSGTVHELGSTEVTETAILDFARQFDPQYFHLDPAAAVSGPFGGIIASGWHTGSMVMRLYVDQFLSGATTNLGSPGLDEIRFLRPVRPGDVLSARATVIEARRSRSKPGRGFVTTRVEVSNQSGETAMTLKITSIFRCREPRA